MSAYPGVSERPRSVSMGLIVSGYVFAVLLPLIGIILGTVALKKYDGTGTNHGKRIVVVAGVMMILGIVLRVMLAAGSA